MAEFSVIMPQPGGVMDKLPIPAGKHKEFEAALQKLHGKDADLSDEAAEIQVVFLNLHTTFHIDNVAEN